MTFKEMFSQFNDNGVKLVYITGDTYLIDNSSCRYGTFINTRYDYIYNITTWHVDEERTDMTKLKELILENGYLQYDKKSHMICLNSTIKYNIDEMKEMSDFASLFYDFRNQIELKVDEVEELLDDNGFIFSDIYEDEYDYESIISKKTTAI